MRSRRLGKTGRDVSEIGFDAVEEVETIASDGATLAQLALRWILGQRR